MKILDSKYYFILQKTEQTHASLAPDESGSGRGEAAAKLSPSRQAQDLAVELRAGAAGATPFESAASSSVGKRERLLSAEEVATQKIAESMERSQDAADIVKEAMEMSHKKQRVGYRTKQAAPNRDIDIDNDYTAMTSKVNAAKDGGVVIGGCNPRKAKSPFVLTSSGAERDEQKAGAIISSYISPSRVKIFVKNDSQSNAGAASGRQNEESVEQSESVEPSDRLLSKEGTVGGNATLMGQA